MLTNETSQKVLTIGCYFKHPHGGIAQVLANYQKYVFPTFKAIVNSRRNSGVKNAWYAISGIVLTFWRLTFDRNIKLVHIHTSSNHSFQRSVLFAHIAKCFGKKVIMHVHSGAFKDYVSGHDDFVRKQLNRVDGIIALSESWKSFFVNELQCEHVYVLNNVISPPLSGGKSVNHDGLSLLFLGLIQKQKGIYDLIDVVHKCARDGVNVKLNIGGNGEVERLKELINELSLQNNVIFHGWVSGEQKAQLFRNNDVLVLPSYYEGLPLSVVEAFSYGKPVIASSVGAIPEIVLHGQNGFLIQPGDVEALQQCIIQLEANQGLLNSMANHASEAALHFLPDFVSTQLEKIYKSVLS